MAASCSCSLVVLASRWLIGGGGAWFLSRDNMSVVLVKFPGAFLGKGRGVIGIREDRERQDKAEAEAEASKKAEAEQNANPRGF